MSSCQCRGGGCEHHRELEACPNEAVPPISVVPDPLTGKPVPNSEYGLCEPCWENQIEKA